MVVSLKSRTLWSSVIAVACVSFIFKGTANAPVKKDWNADNDPAIFEKMLETNFNYTLSQLPASGLISKEKMPWSDTYWSTIKGGIAVRWYNNGNALPGNAADPWSYKLLAKEELQKLSLEQMKNLSAAEKYDIYMGRYDYPTVQVEKGRKTEKMEYWEGICHGWIQAAIHHPEPNPVTLENPDGIKVPFGVSDVNGLLSAYYGVKMYDVARGSRWVGHYGDMIQYLDSVDTYDGGKWVDIDNSMSTTLTTWKDDKQFSTPYTGRNAIFNAVTDGRLCAEDSYLRSSYVAQTYIPKMPELKAQWDSCKRRDDDCRNAVVEYVMNNKRNEASNQCGMDVQVFAYFPHLDEVRQVGMRIEPKKGAFKLFKRQKGLKDVNPGAFHVILANMIGIRDEAFGSNINLSLRNAEIWNQPVVGYSSTFSRDVSDPDPNDGEYHGAKRVAVETAVTYVKEISQHWNPIVETGDEKTETTTFKYTLYLDEQGRIMGGKWADKDFHPNFVWIQKKLDFRGYFKSLEKVYQSKWVRPAATSLPVPAVATPSVSN